VHGALLHALRHPIDSRRFGTWSAGPARGHLGCDITRAQPRRETLRAIFEGCRSCGADVTVMIATGTHRTNTEAELERMLGRDILDSCRPQSRQPRQGVARWHRADATGVDVAEPRMAGGRHPPDHGLRRTTFFAGSAAVRDGGPAGRADTVLTNDAAHRGPRATWGITEGTRFTMTSARSRPWPPPSIDVALNRDQGITAVFAYPRGHKAACARQGHRDAGGALSFDVVVTTNSATLTRTCIRP
jgi:hypothetical protein